MQASRAGVARPSGVDWNVGKMCGLCAALRASGPALAQAAFVGERWLRPSLPWSGHLQSIEMRKDGWNGRRLWLVGGRHEHTEEIHRKIPQTKSQTNRLF